MKKTFQIIIRTPEGEVVSKEVDSVYLTTESGDMMLLPDHAAFSGVITYSPVILNDDGSQEEYLAYRGVVFFSNNKNEALLLCQRCDLKGRVDYNGLRDYLKKVEELIEKGEDMSEYHIKFLKGERLALVQHMDGQEKK